jgi:hypothetical protein
VLDLKNVPEPKDEERVTFVFEVDATMGELRERYRLTKQVMSTAIQDFFGGKVPLEHVESAMHACAQAGAILNAAQQYAMMYAVARKGIDALRDIERNPANAVRHVWNYGEG